MKNLKGKYFGPDKITKVEALEDTTYLGNQRVKVTFENDTTLKIALKAFKDAVTEEKSDLTKLREARVIPVVEKILEVLTESELTWEDIQYAIGSRLKGSLNENLDKAMEKKWGKPFQQNSQKINLLDIDKVITDEED